MALILPFNGKIPKVAPDAFLAPTSVVIGDVQIGPQASVWFGAVLRGDNPDHGIRIGPRSNVQDNAVVHLAEALVCYLGVSVTVGHGAIVHACTIRDEVLVGMGAVVLDGVVVGERSIIGAQALVTGGTEIPPGSLVLGSPAKVVRSLSAHEQGEVRIWAEKYVENRRKFLARTWNQG